MNRFINLGRGLTLAALAIATAGCSLTPPSAPAPVLEKPFAAEIDQFVKTDKVAPPAPCQILFVGSSSIVFWKTLAQDMAPLPVINRGFGGSHIEYVNLWFDQVVAPSRPREIVFYAGENDLDAGKSVKRVIADFDEFMAKKTAALGSTPVYFISVKPSKLRFHELALQTQVNDAIRARAAHRADLNYIDVVSPMMEQGEPKDIFREDQLHMTADGYAIWTQAVRDALLPQADTDEQACRRAAR